MNKTGVKRSPIIYIVALLILVIFSFSMVCRSIAIMTLCNPYTVVDATDSSVSVTDRNGREWSSVTAADIFSVKYSNENGEFTVASQNGKDLIVAPGTSQSYDFRVTNTGSSAIKYTLRAEYSTVSAGKTVPLKVRFSDYKATYFVGNAETWASPSDLNTLYDERTLGAGKYVPYTLDWIWEFEGDDEYDTELGNAAGDYTLTVKLYLVAEWDSGSGEGEDVPDTGDHSHLILWIALMTVSLVLMIFFVIYKRYNEKDDDEAEKSAENRG